MKTEEANGLKLPGYKQKIYRSRSVNEQNIPYTEYKGSSGLYFHFLTLKILLWLFLSTQ